MMMTAQQKKLAMLALVALVGYYVVLPRLRG